MGEKGDGGNGSPALYLGRHRWLCALSPALPSWTRSILKLAVLSLSVAAAILVFSVWSGMFFVRSIVRPIR